VWFLTFGGVLFIIAVYALIFGGLYWVSDFTRKQIAKENPDFEMLYFSTSGKMRVRHKPTRKEFSIEGADVRGKIRIRKLATKPTGLAPNWLRFDGVTPSEDGGYTAAGKLDPVADKVREILENRGFVVENWLEGNVTACDSKTLQCVDLVFEQVKDANQVRYRGVSYEAP
jgi:hypothetical protein